MLVFHPPSGLLVFVMSMRARFMDDCWTHFFIERAFLDITSL